MPRPLPDINRLTLLLQSQGVMGARMIAESLGISPPTLSRLIGRSGPGVERIGAARNTRYALRRQVRHLGSHWPLYRISEAGRPRLWGELRALHGGFRFVPHGVEVSAWMDRACPDGVFSGLPFFLQDVRPQGYLGRAIAREAVARLGVPSDLQRWNDDDVLSYFLTEGYDLPGDLVVGDHALEQALRQTDALADIAIPEAERSRLYPERAGAAQRGEPVGSSTGGEQPKFLGIVQGGADRCRSVLVKFSSADPSPVSQRWADLLICEHLAGETMYARRIPCVRSGVLDAGNRRFLEVERFDRIEAAGRRSVLTLGAIEDAFLERGSTDWSAAAGMLEAERWIDPDQSRVLRWIWCFGDLIANSDMHRSNAGVWFGDEPPYRLAPFYDMLPMLFAPGAQGDLGERTFGPRPPLPAVATVWSDAAAAALDFWARVSADSRVSSGFRSIADRCGGTVRRLLDRFG